MMSKRLFVIVIESVVVTEQQVSLYKANKKFQKLVKNYYSSF